MENGRIAIPSMANGGLDGKRAGHFGHCDTFTLVDVKDGTIDKVTTIANQTHEQGGCMVPVNLLADNQVNALIVGGIGMRPLMGFRQVGIDPVGIINRTLSEDQPTPWSHIRCYRSEDALREEYHRMLETLAE